MIDVADLRKSYGTIHAVAGVSFRVARGEIYGLLGPNGAGKTTIIGALCGLVRPDAGRVSLDGIDVGARPIEARRALGVVPQEVALYTEISARENLRFFGRLYGLGGRALEARVTEVLERVGLADRAREPVSRYSGGMLRRLNIAAGIVHDPRVVLMDEPTVGLDPQARASILDLVEAIARDGAAVLYTTHYLDEAERLCHRLGIIDRGALLAEGTLVELRRAAGEREIVALRGAFRPEAVAAALSGVDGAEVVKMTDAELLFSVRRAEESLPALVAAANASGVVRETAVRQPSLENLFIKLTGRELRD